MYVSIKALREVWTKKGWYFIYFWKLPFSGTITALSKLILKRHFGGHRRTTEQYSFSTRALRLDRIRDVGQPNILAPLVYWCSNKFYHYDKSRGWSRNLILMKKIINIRNYNSLVDSQIHCCQFVSTNEKHAPNGG